MSSRYRCKWIGEEISFLKNNYLSFSDRELASELKRPIRGVSAKRVELKLSRPKREVIKYECPICSKIFFDSRPRKYCGELCQARAASVRMKHSNPMDDPRTAERVRRKNKKFWEENPKEREKVGKRMMGENHISRGVYREKWLAGLRRSWEGNNKRKKWFSENAPSKDPNVAAKISKALKERWKDPEFVSKMMKAQGAKPNKAEKKLGMILSKEFPEYFCYVGCGSSGFNIGGRIPDFVNEENKEIVELFGRFWHLDSNTTEEEAEKERIDFFEKYDYKTAIVWDYELKNEEFVVDEIRRMLCCGVTNLS